MAKSTRQAKSLASTFSSGKTMENEDGSTFVRSGEGGNKRRRMTSVKGSHKALPSSASIFSELTGLPMDSASSTAMQADLITGIKSSKSLSDTNIGFKLLKKSGWKEGSGLGVSEQGRLDPLEAQFKSDRRGIGAEKKLKEKTREPEMQQPSAEDDGKTAKSTKKEKNLARKAKKMKAEEEHMQEQAFEREFYREFWPENV